MEDPNQPIRQDVRHGKFLAYVDAYTRYRDFVKRAPRMPLESNLSFPRMSYGEVR
jgi:hypothetical protein